MIFVHYKSEEWHDEFKASLFRYFKYLPINYGNYSKVIRNLNDTLFLQMPASDNLQQDFGISGHYEEEVIKPEIEFFYELCSNKSNTIRLSDQRRVVLFSTEEFNNSLPNIKTIPPCFTNIPFSMETVIKKKIISDDNCCDKCEWGAKLTRYRNIVHHCNQIRKVCSFDNDEETNEVRKAIQDLKEIEQYQYQDFIGEIDKIVKKASKLFSIDNDGRLDSASTEVYLLEDNKDDCKAIEDVLVNQGFEDLNIRAFTTSEDFINRLIRKSEEPIESIKESNSIVLLDLMLKGDIKQGEEVCKNVNRFRRFLPIFIISRKEDLFELVNSLVGLRINGFFPKQTIIDRIAHGDFARESNKDVKDLYTRFFVFQVDRAVRKAKRQKEEHIYIESQKKQDDRVGIVVAGYGKFSQQTFDNVLRLIGKKDNYELLAIIEPTWQSRQEAKDRLRKENLDTACVVKDFEQLRDFVYKYPGKIFIRDASSSDHHAKNHEECAKESNNENKFFHFVEKPMTLSNSDLDKYRQDKKENKFSCNLSEIENPAVLTVKEYIRENRLQITSMEFWRYCGIAWVQLLEGKRMGVRGGSYMDKTIHDWSVAYFLLSDLLNSYDIEKVIRRAEIDASITLFMPFSCNNLLRHYPDHLFYKSTIENGNDGKDNHYTRDLIKAEDLKMESRVALELHEDNRVKIEMKSSWGGITDNEIETLEDQLTLEGALYTEERIGTVDFETRRNVDYKFFEQELRLGKIETTCCNDKTTKTTIYFNMLERKQKDIYPFVKIVTDNGLQNIRLCTREATPFDRILENSLLYCTGASKEAKAGPEMSIFCHEMALKCLKEAQSNIDDRKDAEAAIANLHKYLKEVGVTFYFD